MSIAAGMILEVLKTAVVATMEESPHRGAPTLRDGSQHFLMSHRDATVALFQIFVAELADDVGQAHSGAQWSLDFRAAMNIHRLGVCG